MVAQGAHPVPVLGTLRHQLSLGPTQADENTESAEAPANSSTRGAGERFGLALIAATIRLRSGGSAKTRAGCAMER